MPGTDIMESISFPLAKKEDVVEAFEDMEAEKFDAFDLPLIHAGTGRSLEWVPERGARAAPTVVSGVILQAQTQRAYYEGDYSGGGDPPLCSSDDGKTGVGKPGGICAQCPLDQFGSGNGNSKACGEKRMIYLLLPNAIIPLVIQVSAGSLGSWKNYLLGVANEGGYKRWTTEFFIETVSGAHGPYPQIGFRPGERLTDESRASVRKYAESMATIIQRAQKPIYQSEGE